MEEIKKPYEFRKLKSTDIFLFTKLIKKIGLSSFGEITMDGDFQKALGVFTGEQGEGQDNELTAGKMVFKITDVILDKLDNCENEILTILTKTSNLSREEVENLDLDIFITMIYDFVKKEEFMGFFKRATQLFKSEK